MDVVCCYTGHVGKLLFSLLYSAGPDVNEPIVQLIDFVGYPKTIFLLYCFFLIFMDYGV